MDRLAGILVALLVIWLVFDQLWPVRTVTAMRRALAGVLRSEARFLRVFESPVPHQSKVHQIDGLRDQIAKAIAGLRTMNDMVVFEFGAHREAHSRVSENILQTALTAVPFFWSQLAVLRHEQDRDFLSEPGLIEMRRKAAAGLDDMANAVAQDLPFTASVPDDLADPSILANARYGEYARNTVAAHHDLQNRVSTLQAGG
jgi:multidrug resistance protein MdtO